MTRGCLALEGQFAHQGPISKMCIWNNMSPQLWESRGEDAKVGPRAVDVEESM